MKQLKSLINVMWLIPALAMADYNHNPQVLTIHNNLAFPVDVVVDAFSGYPSGTQCLATSAPPPAGDPNVSFFTIPSPIPTNGQASSPETYDYQTGTWLPGGFCNPLSDVTEQNARYTVHLKRHNTDIEIGTIIYNNSYDTSTPYDRFPITHPDVLATKVTGDSAVYSLSNPAINFDGSKYQVSVTVGYADPSKAALNFSFSSDAKSLATFVKDAPNTSPDFDLPNLAPGQAVTGTYSMTKPQTISGQVAYLAQDSQGQVIPGLSCTYKYQWNVDTNQCTMATPVVANDNQSYSIICPQADAPVANPLGCSFAVKNLNVSTSIYNLNVSVQNSTKAPLKLQQKSGNGTYTTEPVNPIAPGSAGKFTYAVSKGASNLDNDFVIYSANDDDLLACKFQYAIDTVKQQCLVSPPLNQPGKVSSGNNTLNCATLAANYDKDTSSCNFTFDISGEDAKKFTVNLDNTSSWTVVRNNMVPADSSQYGQGAVPPESIDKGTKQFIFAPHVSLVKNAVNDLQTCKDVTGTGAACVAYAVGDNACELKYGWDQNNKCYATFTPIVNNSAEAIQCYPQGNLSPEQNGSDCKVNIAINPPSLSPINKVNVSVTNNFFTDLAVGNVSSSQLYQPALTTIEDGQIADFGYSVPSGTGSGSQELIYTLLDISDLEPITCQLTFSWDANNCYGEGKQVGNNVAGGKFMTNCNLAKFAGLRQPDNSCNISFKLGSPVQ